MKLLKTKIFGKYKFFYLESDRYIGQRIALEKYEPYETKLILGQTKKGDVVVDVGANIGYYTILLADKVGKTGKVYAFEPDKINFEILKKNIEANNLNNVVAVNAAAGSKNETNILYRSEENLGDHKLYDNFQFSKSNFQKEKVKIIKLDDYLKNIKINLMKIDTQGWEPEVIAGAKGLIEENKPVMFLEYSPASYQIAKLDGKKMMENLDKIYPKIWWIDEWLYIYKNLSQKKIDEICRTNKTGYADLWIKKNTTINDLLCRYGNIKLKQWLKNFLLGYN
ncbi:MAG: FkbM family methyltransferase [Candidatus Shapirobacteria bacterium]|jgi:FkbM family methyltransferase|nr:FkbM family methyltransferase [Candidatus Shapirobacteria bacterium]